MPPHGDPAYRVDELLGVEDAVLEEIADPAVPVGEQLARIQLLHMLGEHEDGKPRPCPPRGERALQPLVRVGRRKADVDDGDVRLQLGQGLGEFGPGLDSGGDLEVERLQHPDQTVTQQEEIFG